MEQNFRSDSNGLRCGIVRNWVTLCCTIHVINKWELTFVICEKHTQRFLRLHSEQALLVDIVPRRSPRTCCVVSNVVKIQDPLAFQMVSQRLIISTVFFESNIDQISTGLCRFSQDLKKPVAFSRHQ